MKMIETRPVQTYQEFLSSLRSVTDAPNLAYHWLMPNFVDRKILNPRYSQKPQLGSSHKIVRSSSALLNASHAARAELFFQLQDINLQFIF